MKNHSCLRVDSVFRASIIKWKMWRGIERMKRTPESPLAWHFSGRECVWLAVGLFGILAFGVNVEQRTALRRTPMTDLGVFTCAAGAVCSGENLYTITDWHGWHYQYPPALAILFTPMALPVPIGPPILALGEPRTESNTPWGYEIASHRRFFGLHRENARFFWIVAVWYILSVALIFLSAHALACALERRDLREPPPAGLTERRHWWWLRTLPLLVCAGSLATDLSRGQVDVVMLAAISFGIYLAASGRELNAGFWLSLPATVKLFPALLIIYPLWRRRWRMVAGALAGTALALVVLPSVVLGPMRTIELYKNWFQVLAKPALGQGTDTSRVRELTGMAGTDNQSLLAFIHNWRFHDLPRQQRPTKAPPVERYAAYAIGGLMLLGLALVIGARRRDTPHELLIIAGLLIGLALVVNPVSHNAYFLLLLPLVAGLLNRGLEDPAGIASGLKMLLVVAVFMLTDLAARLPAIGPWLRDLGLPLLSLVAIMAAGAIALREHKTIVA
ncbi:MAG TPA: glycosyltransferase family 87 protein [Verrucomicrobiae bacterium]|jgi:hypothetical protein|nr:glycosyltransferase family 87 protein [Verrucomicrobiae bacterium]